MHFFLFFCLAFQVTTKPRVMVIPMLTRLQSHYTDIPARTPPCPVTALAQTRWSAVWSGSVTGADPRHPHMRPWSQSTHRWVQQKQSVFFPDFECSDLNCYSNYFSLIIFKDEVEPQTIEDRVVFSNDVQSLSLLHLRSMDTGTYQCLVNNRKKPNTSIRLLVQGKIKQSELYAVLKR